MITVYAPGALTTIQDLGRTGHAASGVPPSGAMDPWSLRAANLLVGNDEGAACLECTLTGPTLAFDAPATIALAGSDADARALVSLPGSEFERDVEARPVPMNRTVALEPGEVLEVGRLRGGARSYLAIAGGIDVAPVLGSRSCHPSAGLGPPPLRAGDVVRTGAAREAPRRARRPIPIPDAVRALPGPQSASFEPAARAAFFEADWTVTPQADRAGVRLEGPALRHEGPAEIDPEGVPRGAVQVPGDGRPIVLCADGPATGGYPKIATVIAADVWVFAHVRPGATLRFVETTVEGARAAWLERERELRASIGDLA